MIPSPVPQLEKTIAEDDREPAGCLEYPVTLLVNGREAVTFLCTPRALVEMITGWLFAESLIESPSEIEISPYSEPQSPRHAVAMKMPNPMQRAIQIRSAQDLSIRSRSSSQSASTQ